MLECVQVLCIWPSGKYLLLQHYISFKAAKAVQRKAFTK